MTTDENSQPPAQSIDNLRHTIRRLQKWANGTRIFFAAILIVIAVAASRNFHILLVASTCLIVIVGVLLIVGIPTQVRLTRARRQLRTRLMHSP